MPSYSRQDVLNAISAYNTDNEPGYTTQDIQNIISAYNEQPRQQAKLSDTAQSGGLSLSKVLVVGLIIWVIGAVVS